MLSYLTKKVFGSVNERTVKKFQKTIDQINELEKNYITMSDDGLKAQTGILKARLKAGESLDEILPNAFAIMREAANRVMETRHYDVQLVGGIVLHRGMIAEMRTGEGKTLVATLAVYLNALTEKGVHVVTVNDYLANRDAEWMGQVYKFLGLSVGCILHGLTDEQRKEAYDCDVTYGTNHEFGFDYLRDNMKFSRGSMVQREFNYVVVDEVDSILIDEARTPLIISGPTEDNSKLYYDIDKLIPELKGDHYEVDEKDRNTTLTEEGTEYIEQLLKKKNVIASDEGLYDIKHVGLVHHINQALRAHKLFKNETDYIVRNNEVIIVDEFTGRAQEGRRFSDGLHQALEAKENVKIQNENQTLASITYQNYFRMFPKLAGMTGTAMTEAVEFEEIYELKTVTIPTNKPIAREDCEDVIYKTAAEKYNAIVKDIKEASKRGQPVLVGTVSIEKSELVSKLLKKAGVKHNVLNAKYHEKEAYIVTQAGVPGAITIATNMAGRGTDIMLGGNPDMMVEEECSGIKDEGVRTKKEKEIRKKVAENKEFVLEAGGLYIIGTERHESRRIDNQLRGRSGRQGDPGKSKFFLSLDDDLMRIFGSGRLSTILSRLGLKDDEAIVHPWISRSLEKAQQKVEMRNYEIRKNLLKYDDIVNEQRKIIFEQRKELMESENISSEIEYLIEEINNSLVSYFIPPKSHSDDWDLDALDAELYRVYAHRFDIKGYVKENNVVEKEILELLNNKTISLLKEKQEKYGKNIMSQVERHVYLMTIDASWKDHLYSLDRLRKGIGLRSYAQKDPLIEYKKDAFSLFEEMLSRIAQQVVARVSRVEFSLEEVGEITEEDRQRQSQGTEGTQDPAFVNNNRTKQRGVEVSTEPRKSKIEKEERDPKNPMTWGKVGRNDDCPCGSGKKYKQCHGK